MGVSVHHCNLVVFFLQCICTSCTLHGRWRSSSHVTFPSTTHQHSIQHQSLLHSQPLYSHDPLFQRQQQGQHQEKQRAKQLQAYAQASHVSRSLDLLQLPSFQDAAESSISSGHEADPDVDVLAGNIESMLPGDVRGSDESSGIGSSSSGSSSSVSSSDGSSSSSSSSSNGSNSIRRSRSKRRRLLTPVLTYNNNGPIMHSPITVHLVWYGEFEEQFKTTVRTFVQSISNRSDPANTRTCSRSFHSIPSHCR